MNYRPKHANVTCASNSDLTNAGALGNTGKGIIPLVVMVLLIHSSGCEPSVSLNDARVLVETQQFKKAATALREMVDAGNMDPEVLYLYGISLSAMKQGDSALWPLRRAMESPDWIVKAGTQIANNALHAENNDTAIAAADRVLEVDPENVTALVLRSRARLGTRRNLELALADADRALELDPDEASARVARLLALLTLEMIEEAALALSEIEERSYEVGADQPDSARYCVALASFAKENGEVEKADERYGKCLVQFPGSQVLVADALDFYEKRGESDRSIEILEAAVADEPFSREFRVGLVLRLANLGRHDEAEQILREATEFANPSFAAGAWVDLAGYLIERDKIADGVVAFEEALELIQSPASELVFRYADALLAAEQYDRAIELADTMTITVYRHLLYGRVHLARGEYAEALSELAAGLQEWPENAVVRYYAALAAEGLGDFERAIEEFRYSIRAASDQTDARLRLARFHQAEGSLSDALMVLRHDMATHPPDFDMALLELEILARGGQTNIPSHLLGVVNQPGLWQRAIVAVARGTNLRFGPVKAAEYLAGLEIDLTDPANALILKDRVQYMSNIVERSDEAVSLAKISAEAKPEVAEFHAVLGLAMLRAKDGNDEARSRFERALKLVPNNADALIGMGILAEDSGQATRALDFYLTAAAANTEDSSALEAAIVILTALGRVLDAEQGLEQLLERNPYAGEAALRLVQLRIQRGAHLEPRSRVLAKLAMRFGGRGSAAAEALRQTGVR